MFLSFLYIKSQIYEYDTQEAVNEVIGESTFFKDYLDRMETEFGREVKKMLYIAQAHPYWPSEDK